VERPSAIEVHFWWALVEDLEGDVTAGEALLTGDQVARYRRYHFERDRRAFLARRALERSVLSRYAPARPRHNPSSSGGLVACVVATADVEVGVDVEQLDRRAPLDVGETSFAAAEVAALRGLPPEEQPRRFFDHWTLKEAYVKARRRGLVIPLDQFAFVLEPGAPIGVTFSPQLGDDAAWWEFRQLQPTRDYLAAVAVRRPPGVDVELVVRRAA
jgi:4'-phosphopantetheinyl transferase